MRAFELRGNLDSTSRENEIQRERKRSVSKNFDTIIGGMKRNYLRGGMTKEILAQ